MRPALSVVLLTTLIGAGQGLFLALYGAELAARAHLAALPPSAFFAAGSAIALALTGAGLLASTFHLGHPERGWRAAAGWRTSWLSREVILLPAFMAALSAYGAAHHFALGHTLALGLLGALLALALYIATGMVYAAIRFLQEWATPLTPLNYLLLGCASGTALAAAYAALAEAPLAAAFARAAFLLTLAAALLRLAALARNRTLRARSTLQSAIGIAHPAIRQVSQGFMGGSFNTREFFHGQTTEMLRALRWSFLVLAFALPLLLLGLAAHSAGALSAAFALQYVGLLAERWYFLADANHPQNLYYQATS